MFLLELHKKMSIKNNQKLELVEIFVLDQKSKFINKEGEKIVMKVLANGNINDYISNFTFSKNGNNGFSGTSFTVPYSTLKEWSKLDKLDIRFQNSQGLKVDASFNIEELNLIKDFSNKAEEVFSYDPEKPVG